MLFGPAHAELFRGTFVGIGVFSRGTYFSAKIVVSQMFLRLYIHEFLSELFSTFNIYTRHYELYIIMTYVMHIFIVREIQLFEVK